MEARDMLKLSTANNHVEADAQKRPAYGGVRPLNKKDKLKSFSRLEMAAYAGNDEAWSLRDSVTSSIIEK